MNSTQEFRGYYCTRCHSYTRLYRDSTRPGFSGTCPGCGTKLYLDPEAAENGFFFTGGKGYRHVNVWDSYFKRRKIGEVKVGTHARVLETKVYNGVKWYRVKAGAVEGWVSGTFIRRLR